MNGGRAHEQCQHAGADLRGIPLNHGA
jgi:hypothetical protein